MLYTMTPDENKNNITCVLLFQVLQESQLLEETGCFVYNLEMLQGSSFHDVVPTNRSMNNL